MLPDVEHIGGLVVVATPPTPSPPPILFSFSSTGETAFVLAHSIVHHSGTKRLNQVAWSNSPWGFNATETTDYSFTVPVLQKTPLWHSTMWQTIFRHIPTMQNSAKTMRFLSWWRKDTEIYRTRSGLKCTTLTIYWKCSIHVKNGKWKITF